MSFAVFSLMTSCSYAICVHSLKEIVPENSTWAMASVGRMTFTLSKKTAPAKWARLLVHKNKLPNMHFW